MVTLEHLLPTMARRWYIYTHLLKCYDAHILEYDPEGPPSTLPRSCWKSRCLMSRVGHYISKVIILTSKYLFVLKHSISAETLTDHCYEYLVHFSPDFTNYSHSPCLDALCCCPLSPPTFSKHLENKMCMSKASPVFSTKVVPMNHWYQMSSWHENWGFQLTDIITVDNRFQCQLMDPGHDSCSKQTFS